MFKKSKAPKKVTKKVEVKEEVAEEVNLDDSNSTPCENCRGTGLHEGSVGATMLCSNCAGSGRVKTEA